jgi:hypothetical protein
MMRSHSGGLVAALRGLFFSGLTALCVTAAACAAPTEANPDGEAVVGEEAITSVPQVWGLLHSWPGPWREDMQTDVPDAVLRGNTLYAVMGRHYLMTNMPPADAWQLAVVDVTNRKQPKALTGAALFRYEPQPLLGNLKLALSGDRLFIVDEHRVLTFDVSGPPQNAPRQLSSVNLDAPLVRGVRGIVASGSHLYVSADTGLFVVDTTLADGPDTVLRIDRVGADVLFPAGIAVSGKKLYLGDRKVGVRVFDISNPAAPVSVGATKDFEGNLVHVQGAHVLVSGLEGRPGRQFAAIRKYDLSNLASPVIVSSMRTGMNPYAITAGPSCLVVGYGTPNMGTQVVDTTGPTMAPKTTLVGTVATISLTMAGTLVVASRDNFGLELHTVTCP